MKSITLPGGIRVESNGSLKGDCFLSTFADACADQDQRQAQWVSTLRARGICAAHPNDGWVDREKKTVTFSYPQFDDGVKVGVLVVLGWPWGKTCLLVRLLSVSTGPTGLLEHWQYEIVGRWNNIKQQIEFL